MEAAYKISEKYTGGRYQLRHAAGLFWLIDMEQSGGAYIQPVPLNEVGAMLWRQIAGGASLEELCRQLCAEYGISMEEAQSDARDFLRQLQTMHIDFGGLI